VAERRGICPANEARQARGASARRGGKDGASGARAGNGEKLMVRVLYSRTAGASELNAVKIVEFLGVNAQLLPIEHAEPGAGDCWIASATTLASGVAPKVGRGFIYGFDVGNSTVLRELTGGAMNSLEP